MPLQRKEIEYLVIGGGFLFVALMLYFVVFPLQITSQPGELVSSNIFPEFATIFLGLLGLGFLYDAFKLYKNRINSLNADVQVDRVSENPINEMHWGSFLLAMGLLLSYVVAFFLLGFVISTFLFLVLSMLWFKAAGPFKCFFIAAFFTLVLYLIFEVFMLIRLPRGLLMTLFTF